jgi:oligopeptide/dipeptide ABC transporter ATP-binding protein
MPALLQVRGLNVALNSLPVVSGVSFDLAAGGITGLFGESGCGKTTLAQALLNLLPRPRYRVEGVVEFEGRNLLELSERELQPIRGGRISLMFQDPLLALNPVLRAGTQIAEVARAHHVARPELPSSLGLLPRHPDAYPHQLSGGERQRVALAQALACRPSLVIADEPFTALDAARVEELSALFRELRRSPGMSFLLIAHDPAVLEALADSVLVMYAGRIVERGRPRQVFGDPQHPYTRGLIGCLRPRGPDGRLYSIPGNPPRRAARAGGCAFEPRCGDRMDVCSTRLPAEFPLSEDRSVRCFKYER